MNPEEVMQKYEKYINPSSTRLFRFMGLSSVEARWAVSACLRWATNIRKW